MIETSRRKTIFPVNKQVRERFSRILQPFVSKVPMASPETLVLIPDPLGETKIKRTKYKTHFRHSDPAKVIDPTPEFVGKNTGNPRKR